MDDIIEKGCLLRVWAWKFVSWVRVWVDGIGSKLGLCNFCSCEGNDCFSRIVAVLFMVESVFGGFVL